MTLPRLALVPLALLLLGGCNTTRLSAARVGAADARREIEAGTLAQETFDFGADFPHAYEDYLAARGVEFRVVGSGLTDDRIDGHADGFNRVMKDAIRKKLGPDIFEQAKDQFRPIPVDAPPSPFGHTGAGPAPSA